LLTLLSTSRGFAMPFFRTIRSVRYGHAAVVTTAAMTILGLSGCGLTTAQGDSDDRTISIIVTDTPPYQEPTEIARELLAEQGWELDATYVTDIIQPNEAVTQGEYDANFFQ